MKSVLAAAASSAVLVVASSTAFARAPAPNPGPRPHAPIRRRPLGMDDMRSFGGSTDLSSVTANA